MNKLFLLLFIAVFVFTSDSIFASRKNKRNKKPVKADAWNWGPYKRFSDQSALLKKIDADRNSNRKNLHILATLYGQGIFTKGKIVPRGSIQAYFNSSNSFYISTDTIVFFEKNMDKSKAESWWQLANSYNGLGYYKSSFRAYSHLKKYFPVYFKALKKDKRNARTLSAMESYEINTGRLTLLPTSPTAENTLEEYKSFKKRKIWNMAAKTFLQMWRQERGTVAPVANTERYLGYRGFLTDKFDEFEEDEKLAYEKIAREKLKQLLAEARINNSPELYRKALLLTPRAEGSGRAMLKILDALIDKGAFERPFHFIIMGKYSLRMGPNTMTAF